MEALEFKDLPIKVMQITNYVLISNQSVTVLKFATEPSMKQSLRSCPTQSGSCDLDGSD